MTENKLHRGRLRWSSSFTRGFAVFINLNSITKKFEIFSKFKKLRNSEMFNKFKVSKLLASFM